MSVIVGNRLLRYLLTIKNNIYFELPDNFNLILLDSSDNVMVPIFETDGIQTIANEVDISDDCEGYRLPFDYEYITEEVLLKLLGQVKYIKIYLSSSARKTEGEFWITEVDKNKILSYNSDFNNWEFYGMGSMCIERIGGYNMRYYSHSNDVGTALTVRERIYCIDLPTGEDLYNYGKFIEDFNARRKIRG